MDPVRCDRTHLLDHNKAQVFCGFGAAFVQAKQDCEHHIETLTLPPVECERLQSYFDLLNQLQAE
jgi:hypothetical protein